MDKAAARIAEENEDLKRRLAVSDSRIERLESGIADLRQERKRYKGEYEHAALEVTRAREREDELQQRYEARLAEISTETDEEIANERRSAESAVAALSSSLAAFKRWLACGVSLAVVIGITAAVLISGRARTPTQIAVVLGWATITAVALLGIPMRKTAAMVLALLLSLFGIVGLSYQLWVS